MDIITTLCQVVRNADLNPILCGCEPDHPTTTPQSLDCAR